VAAGVSDASPASDDGKAGGECGVQLASAGGGAALAFFGVSSGPRGAIELRRQPEARSTRAMNLGMDEMLPGAHYERTRQPCSGADGNQLTRARLLRGGQWVGDRGRENLLPRPGWSSLWLYLRDGRRPILQSCRPARMDAGLVVDRGEFWMPGIWPGHYAESSPCP